LRAGKGIPDDEGASVVGSQARKAVVHKVVAVDPVAPAIDRETGFVVGVRGRYLVKIKGAGDA
jgi:hypothetical protein